MNLADYNLGAKVEIRLGLRTPVPGPLAVAGLRTIVVESLPRPGVLRSKFARRVLRGAVARHNDPFERQAREARVADAEISRLCSNSHEYRRAVAKDRAERREMRSLQNDVRRPPYRAPSEAPR